ncbi:hypothetical protein BX666DRAFT_1926026 [Dichotomocladium elegans]|nr:hypothetical protein BX666DRAFT_1926026 [Dichotomocladium elegans]
MEIDVFKIMDITRLYFSRFSHHRTANLCISKWKQLWHERIGPVRVDDFLLEVE